MTSFNNRSSKSKLGYQLLSVQAQDHLVRVQFHFDSPSSVPPPSPFRMRIFSGSGSRKIPFRLHTCISDDSLTPQHVLALPSQITFWKHGVRQFLRRCRYCVVMTCESNARRDSNEEQRR